MARTLVQQAGLSGSPLRNLSETGAVPETRLSDAEAAAARVQEFIRNDQDYGRAEKRTLIKLELDGRPPFDPSALIEAGAAHVINVNTRIAEAFINQARSAFYDIFSESETFAEITLDDGPPDLASEWASIMTAEFDRLLRNDRRWLTVMQQSQYNMVVYGTGPLVFLDKWDWRNDWLPPANLLLPEYARANPEDWDEAAIVREYSVEELYQHIRDPEAATLQGWSPEATRKSIIAAGSDGPLSRQWSWERWEEQLKTSSLKTGTDCRRVQCAHYFFREFPREDEDSPPVTHGLVDLAHPEYGWLYRAEREYEHWHQIVHPMYLDNDGGGLHHAITGLGMRMFGLLQVLNRLYCCAADKALAPKLVFRPLTQRAEQAWSVASFGDYARIPRDWELVQTPVGSYLQDSLAAIGVVSDVLARNLSSYQMFERKRGNPVTATEASLDYSLSTQMHRTQLAHLYDQLDALYAEKFRRVVALTSTKLSGGRMAIEFKKRCKEKGVPEEAFKKAMCRAARTIGQGSAVTRRAALNTLLNTLPMWTDESGRLNLLRDFIAGYAGRALVDRYVGRKRVSAQEEEQRSVANLQIAAAKVGVPAVVAPSHNPAIFAPMFVEAGVQAIQTAGQSGQVDDALRFVGAIGPAVRVHLARMSQDASRKQAVADLGQAWDQVEEAAAQMAEQTAQQAQQPAEQGGGQNEMSLKAMETMAKLALRKQALDASLGLRRQRQEAENELARRKAEQEAALADAKVASQIRRDALRESEKERPVGPG